MEFGQLMESLLNSIGGVGSVGAWFRGWRESVKFWRGSEKWRG